MKRQLLSAKSTKCSESIVYSLELDLLNQKAEKFTEKVQKNLTVFINTYYSILFEKSNVLFLIIPIKFRCWYEQERKSR